MDNIGIQSLEFSKKKGLEKARTRESCSSQKGSVRTQKIPQQAGHKTGGEQAYAEHKVQNSECGAPGISGRGTGDQLCKKSLHDPHVNASENHPEHQCEQTGCQANHNVGNCQKQEAHH